MRAGLIVAGASMTLALASVETAHAAPAPVPCTNQGNGHYSCNWYVPGDGVHGGSLVVVGTTTVGYLHQGQNWVVCQQIGGDMHNAAGNRNHWFGWTQADNSKWGWASPLDASGGDDYGPFGGGTPNCNGAHGSPPAYTGVWGHPPAPLPPGATPTPTPVPGSGVDADRDGVSAPVDCDDTNSRVYPGAQEVANDGIDQDCNGADAAGRLSAVVGNSWVAGRRSTRVARLRVSEAPAGATIVVSCSGKRCPTPRTFSANAEGKATLTRMFKRRLRPGATVDVAISAPNTVGKVVRFTIRRNHLPRTQTLCLPPGAPKPERC